MNYTAEQLEKACKRMSGDYATDINEVTDFDNSYCKRFCPYSSVAVTGKYDDDDYHCPAAVHYDDDDDEHEEYEVDEDICRKIILKWYVEHSQ